MSDFREEEKLGKIYDTRLTRRLLGYLRPYRWLVALVFSFTLAWTGTQLIQGYLWKVVIDGYIDPGFAHKIARNVALRGVLIVAVIYLSMLLASFVLQYAQVRIMLIVGQRTMYDLRKEIFERLQRLPVSFFDRSPIGRLVTRATTDVDAL
ncbi:MAG: ABC transporter ATP-binding protein, partial [Acidobacteriota bacterium]|nr:ABC transporter ATP-binding protein [Acidobacteriota bacterium]